MKSIEMTDQGPLGNEMGCKRSGLATYSPLFN
jgi:hypothetical protein